MNPAQLIRIVPRNFMIWYVSICAQILAAAFFVYSMMAFVLALLIAMIGFAGGYVGKISFIFLIPLITCIISELAFLWAHDWRKRMLRAEFVRNDARSIVPV